MSRAGVACLGKVSSQRCIHHEHLPRALASAVLHPRLNGESFAYQSAGTCGKSELEAPRHDLGEIKASGPGSPAGAARAPDEEMSTSNEEAQLLFASVLTVTALAGQSEFEVQNAQPRKNGGDLFVGMVLRVLACNVEQNGGLPAPALVVGEDMRADERCLSRGRRQQEQTWLTKETPDVAQSQGPKKGGSRWEDIMSWSHLPTLDSGGLKRPPS